MIDLLIVDLSPKLNKLSEQSSFDIKPHSIKAKISIININFNKKYSKLTAKNINVIRNKRHLKIISIKKK